MRTFKDILSELGEALDYKFSNTAVPPTGIPPVTPPSSSSVIVYALPDSTIPVKFPVVAVEHVANINPAGKAYKIFTVKFDDGKSRTYRIDESGILSCGKNIFSHPAVTIINGRTASEMSNSVIDVITPNGGLAGDGYAFKF